MNIIDMNRVGTVILRQRRKTLITPCKRSAARGKRNLSHPQPRSGLNSYGVPVWLWDRPTPSSASLARGYQRFTPKA